MTPSADPVRGEPLPYLVRPASRTSLGSAASEPDPAATRLTRTSPPSPGRAPLLVLLHGYGGDAHAMLPLAELLHPRFAVVIPEGPVPLPNGGWGWYELGAERPTGRVVDVPGLTAARRAILQVMGDAAAELDADAGRIYLCGHSQGAALALAIAITEPERMAGVVAVSGRVVPEVMGDAAEPARTAGLPVLLVHGTHDPVVPVLHARAARTLLAERGARVTYREHDAEHGVTREMVGDANDWLDAELGRPR